MNSDDAPVNQPPTIEIVNNISKQLQKFGTNLNNWPVVLYSGTLVSTEVTYAYATNDSAGDNTDTLSDIESGDSYNYSPGTTLIFQQYENIVITVNAPGNFSDGDETSSMSLTIDLSTICPSDDITITIGYQNDAAQNSWSYLATVAYGGNSQQLVFDEPCQNLPN